MRSGWCATAPAGPQVGLCRRHYLESSERLAEALSWAIALTRVLMATELPASSNASGEASFPQMGCDSSRRMSAFTQDQRRFGPTTRAAARFFLALAEAVVRKPSRRVVRLEAAKTAVSVRIRPVSMVLIRSVDPVPQSAQQQLASIRTPSRVAFGGPQDQGWLPVLRTATRFPSTHTTWSGSAQWLRSG